jgi:hypothetical protein
LVLLHVVTTSIPSALVLVPAVLLVSIIAMVALLIHIISIPVLVITVMHISLIIITIIASMLRLVRGPVVRTPLAAPLPAAIAAKPLPVTSTISIAMIGAVSIPVSSVTTGVIAIIFIIWYIIHLSLLTVTLSVVFAKAGIAIAFIIFTTLPVVIVFMKTVLTLVPILPGLVRSVVPVFIVAFHIKIFLIDE